MEDERNIKHSLGLSSKVSKSYREKTSDDVIKELEAIDPADAFNIICSAIKKNHKLSNNLRYDEHNLTLEVEFLKAPVGKDIYLTGYVNVDIFSAGQDQELTFDFMCFFFYFLVDGHFHRAYLDFVLPDATIYKTYKWNEIYQNFCSFPYEMSRSNVAKVSTAIEDLSDFSSEFIQKFTVGSDIDAVIKATLSKYTTDDLWEYAREHGALVATDESSKVSFQESLKCKPVEILREARKTQSGDVLEALENSIEKLYGIPVNLKKNFSLEENTITISDAGNRVFNTIDMTLIEGWKPYDSEACLEDYNDRVLIEETIAKEAAKMIGRRPSNLGLCKKLEENKK